MLMQPGTAPTSGAYDFLNQQPSQSGSKLPLPKLPKLAWVILIASVSLLGLLVLIAVLFGGKNGNSSPFINSLALAQEINRISDKVKNMSEDPNTQALAATASSVMVSNNMELITYLKDIGIKVNEKSLSSKEDSNIDSQLDEAAKSNRLPEAYARYLNTYLADYQQLLETAFSEADSEAKAILQQAYDSADLILSSPIVKAANES